MSGMIYRNVRFYLYTIDYYELKYSHEGLNLHYISFNGQANLLRIGARRRTGRQRVEIAGNPRAVLAAENAAIEL